MRARKPDVADRIERDGVALAYEIHGQDNAPTILLMPNWSIVHSRLWKAQVPYLSRHFRVVSFDGRGCGRSGRPVGPAAYNDEEFVADAVAVLDATETRQATLAAMSGGAGWSVGMAAQHPDRVSGIVAIGPGAIQDPSFTELEAAMFTAEIDDHEGWASYNRKHWLDGGYEHFTRFFFSQMFPEPHSTKQIEDCIGWARESSPSTIADTVSARLGLHGASAAPIERLCALVQCEVLVIHGTDDRICSFENGERLAAATGAAFVAVEGGGHGIPARDPVLINRLIKEFVERTAPGVAAPPRRLSRALQRPKRALYLSSPIGLGHARRDLAIARELRTHHPDLEIDWLAQHPVTAVLGDAGERVHPASAWLANESAHIEDECADHDLHAFQAIRRMDEILVSNFMVFQDLVEGEHYDLVIGDEAWDVDHFLHENPELKRFAFAWMTDFVGWLPMPDGGPAEARLTADYNAEMIEQRARFRRLRDRSIFVGDPEDIVPDTFGPDLPAIRDWTEREFDFAGYVTGFDPITDDGRDALRAELGYRNDERVCIVTVGGSAVGEPLLRRVLDAMPAVRRSVADLRFVVVTGPRIDPGALPKHEGVTLRSYVPDLHRHLAACDIAVVQGGLTTCMELTANRRPFIYVPLRHHFEQTFHVRHRLDRYGAGRCLPYDELCPGSLAAAIATELDRPIAYGAVATDGAARAASMLAELL
ncbi:MAG: alpha/beta fold hydrolase [Acidimicrobiales bacterium]|nr:alpha/beta fold hydrolase [Acidimicrobiales bacterium]